jgi:hypothetical protein
MGVTMQHSPPSGSQSQDNRLWRDRYWIPFCLAILLLKLALLVLDPQPKLFYGDSGSYIWCALSGWIPGDRSYFIGYVIRWLCVAPASFTPLLVVQTLLSGATALLAALICHTIAGGRRSLSYCVGVICALDPMQLLWERYVMAETISLFFYAWVLYFSVLYLRRPRLSLLCAVHVCGVLAIGFRMSYLLVTQLPVPLLPILAFLPEIVRAVHRGSAFSMRKPLFGTVIIHLLVSCIIFWLLHTGYKRLNGRLSHREPDYLYATGLHLLSFWAPVLEPADAADERLGRIIAKGDQYGIKDLFGRNAQRYSPGHLIDLWEKTETDPKRANDIARQTALNALRHHPVQVMGLAVRTFLQYFDLRILHENAGLDLGYVDIPPADVTLLANRFHFSVNPRVRSASPTLLQRYFLFVWPYYYVVLLSPGITLFAICLGRQKRSALIILIHGAPTLALSLTVAGGPTVRYLQPISLLTILTAAVCVDGLSHRRERRLAAETVDSAQVTRLRTGNSPEGTPAN